MPKFQKYYSEQGFNNLEWADVVAENMLEEFEIPDYYDWQEMHPTKKELKSYEEKNYTQAQVDSIHKTAQLSILANSFSMLSNLARHSEVGEQLYTNLSRVNLALKPADKFESPEDYTMKMAGVAVFLDWISDKNNLTKTLDAFGSDNMKITFIQNMYKLQDLTKAKFSIDNVIVETDYKDLLGKLGEKQRERTAQENEYHDEMMKNRTEHKALDSPELAADLKKSGLFIRNSSDEHQNLVDKYDEYMKFATGQYKMSEGAQKTKLEELRKAAENYVTLKRDGKWDENQHWRPETPTGEKRFEAALSIIKLTRNALGMGEFTVDEQKKCFRELNKVRHAPRNNAEACENCVAGMQDQFRVEDSKKISDNIERAQNEIKKILNEGKPSAKQFDTVRRNIGDQLKNIIVQNTKNLMYRNNGSKELDQKTLDTIDAGYNKMMGGLNNWKSLSKLASKTAFEKNAVLEAFRKSVPKEKKIPETTQKPVSKGRGPMTN